MATVLTDAERETLNAAAAIILAHTPVKASWSLSPQNFHGSPDTSVTYFDTYGGQHSEHAGEVIRGDTFADKVQRALDIQVFADEGAEGYKARRIAKLQAELASLADAA